MNTVLKEILDAKRYVRDGSPALNNREYLEPVIDNFLNYCSEDSLIVKASHLQENANDDNTLNTAYGRILLQGKIAENDILDSSYTVGMVVVLDKNIPEFITYGGYEVWACTNLSIFGDGQVEIFKDNHKLSHNSINFHLQQSQKRREEYIQFHNNLHGKGVGGKELDELIGYLLRKTIKNYPKIGTSAILHAEKEMLNNKSSYYAANMETNLWNVYNAITDYYSIKFKDGDGLAERPVKTKDLYHLFSEINEI